MRVLTNKEESAVSGGLLPPPDDTGQGGSGSSGSSTGGSGTLLGRQDVQQLADQSGLSSLLAAGNIQVIEGQVPGGAPGASSISGNDIYIPADRIDGYSAGQVLEQIAHELGHIEHPMDNNALDFATSGAYTAAQLTGEGWAQIEAIQTSDALAPLQDLPWVPGDHALGQEEVGAYFYGLSQGESLSDIAQDIGFLMSDQTLDSQVWNFGTDMGSDLTYSMYYGDAWEQAWDVQSF